jgi:Mn-dependent DtxR family transcriptional regulator
MTAPISTVDETCERLCLAFSAPLITNGFRQLGHRSAIDTLLMLAIAQANLAPMERDPEFQKAYAGLEASPPDEMRRPARVRSIAVSLGVPQETARRRVVSLAEAGVLVMRDDGVIMPQAFTNSPHALEMALETWGAFTVFYANLRRAGALGPVEPAAPDQRPPMRQMMRLWTNHFLRLIEALMPMVGDPFAVVMLFAILDGSLAADGKPATASAIARALGLPFESVRRNALRIADNGLCQKVGRGYLIPPALMREPRWRAFSERHAQILMRFFAAMREQNLLGWWEAQYLAEGGRP